MHFFSLIVVRISISAFCLLINQTQAIANNKQALCVCMCLFVFLKLFQTHYTYLVSADFG